MMGKTLKAVVVLLVLFVACYMGAHYYIRWKNTKTDDVTRVMRIVDCGPNEFRAVSLVQTSGVATETLTFRREDRPAVGVPDVTALARWQWSFSGPGGGGEADPVLLRRIASTICELYDPVQLRAEEFRALEAPARAARSIVAEIGEGEKARKVQFEFGSFFPDHSGQLRVTNAAGAVKVYRIPDRFFAVASLAPQQYRNLRVMRLDADNVQQATLKIDGKERFTLERAGADWKVLLGGKEKGGGSEEAEKFLNRISTLRALDVENPSYPPSACASTKARATLEMRGVAGLAETLRFDYGRGGDVAACSSQRNSRYRVHRDLVKYLDVPLKQVVR